MTPRLKITRGAPVEKLPLLAQQFRRWQDHCRAAGLPEPTLTVSNDYHIAPVTANTSSSLLLQCHLTIEATRPTHGGITFCHTNTKESMCSSCGHSVPARQGWTVLSQGALTTLCTPCSTQTPDVLRKQCQLLMDGEALFTQGDVWETWFQETASLSQAGRYVSTAGFLHLAEQLIRKEGFIKSDQPRATRDRILLALREPGHPDIAWLDGVQACIHYQTEDRQRLDNLAYFQHAQKQNTYIDTARDVLAKPYVDLENTLHTGILASIPNTLKHHFTGASCTQTASAPPPIGNEKERGPLLLTLTAIKSYTDREFPTRGYYFYDQQGRQYEWYASESVSVPVNKGQTIRLVATIKKHRQRNDGSTVTVLTRCADFTLASRSDPTPDFSEGVKKRAFKERVQCDIKVVNANDEVDGQCHLHFQREWKHDGRIVNVSLCIPVMDSKSAITTLREGMEAHIGTPISRRSKCWEKTVRNQLLHYTTGPLLPKSLYVVDDATERPFCQSQTNSSLFSDAIQRARQPVMFSSKAQATDYSRRYTFSRILTLQWKDPKVMAAPASAKHLTQYQHEELCSEAKKRGVDVIAYYDHEQTHYTRLIPISLTFEDPTLPIAITQQVLGQYPKARGLERKLAGIHVVVITGFKHQSATDKLLADCRQYRDKLKIKGLDVRWIDTATTLAGVSDMMAFPRGNDKPILIFSDAATACVLEQLGAKVRQLHLSKEPTKAMTQQGCRIDLTPYRFEAFLEGIALT